MKNKKLMEDKKLLVRGVSKDSNEIFFVFNGKDERDPHSYIMAD